MAPKTRSRPSFCEWVVGSRVEQIAAFQAKQEPTQKRDVIRFDVTTDDEAEEDTLTVTYPRSGRLKPATNANKDAVVKKVRFHEAPSKPAIKNGTVVASPEADGDTSDSASKSEQESSDAETSDAPSEKPAKGRGRRRRRRRKSKKNKRRSAVNPHPHPTCQCHSCVRSREMAKCQAAKSDEAKTESEEATTESEETTTDSEASSNEAVVSKPQLSDSEKKKKAVEADADDEASSSSATPDGQVVAKPDQHKCKGKGAKQQHRCEKESQPSSAEEGNKTAAAEGGVKATKVKRKHSSNGRRKKDYPAAIPGPQPRRRPQLIEPIRAEVLQTEKVVETAEDPPPNAFYDPKHGVVRVYHGPVYGNHSGHALYPHRYEPSGPLPPMGMQQHSQNPYLYGFNQAPPMKHGPSTMPITQGMPVSSLQAMCAPPGLAPPGLAPPGLAPPGLGPPPGLAPGVGYAPGGYGPAGAYAYGTGAYPYGGFVPAPWPQATAQGSGFKGAFSMAGANGASPISRHVDNGGANNVAPGIAPGDNPYYPGPGRSRSQNGTASSRATFNASQAATSPMENDGWPSNDGMVETTQWGIGPGNQTTGALDDGNNQAQQQPPWDNGMDSTPMYQPTNEGAAAAGWDHQADGQGAAGAANEWEAAAQQDNSGSNNNIMPGSFPPLKPDMTSTQW